MNAAGTDGQYLGLQQRDQAAQSVQRDRGELSPGDRVGSAQTLLGGVSVGRQITDNFRNTGYFNDSATAITAPVSNPTIAVPVTFRPKRHRRRQPFHGHVAVGLRPEPGGALGAVAGDRRARYEHFDVDFYNHRNNDALSRTDDLISPRAGLLFKPVEASPLYSSYSVSALPSSGDQFSSLTATNADARTGEVQELRDRRQVGRLRPALACRARCIGWTEPTRRRRIRLDPTRTVQTGSQRTKGFEFSLTGAVSPAVAGHRRVRQSGCEGHQPRPPRQPEGARVPLVPRNTVSLWNRYQATQPGPRAGRGLPG